MDDTLDFANDNAATGYRLQYLEVLNWGTFNNHIWRIEPNGSNSLLTGDIGSGKSTLVDALTCLLVPHHRIVFNKAAGAETKERTLKSYIKGEFKKEKIETTNTAKEVYLREEDNDPSIILANFFNEGYQENITLVQIFWMKDNSPEKLLMISSRSLSIESDLGNFSDVPELKKRLKKSEHIKLFDDNFSKYSDEFRRRFGMTTDKAIDLFYQTVSLKSVNSLTDFVRDHMLEKTDVKQKILELRKRLEDLTLSHDAVKKANEQLNILRPMVGYSQKYDELTKEIEDLEKIINVIPIYFSSVRHKLLGQQIEEDSQELNKVQNKIIELENKVSLLREKETKTRVAIYENGGSRLEEIEKEIKHHEKLKEEKFIESEKYNTLITQCNLPVANSEKTFYLNLKKIQELQNGNVLKQEELSTEQVQFRVKESHLTDEIKREENELNSLRNRKTQIPLEMLQIRDRISAELKIPFENIPFVGELIKVKDDEKQWEGAIERLLRSFGLSMIVPEKYYQEISKYVNSIVLKDNLGRTQRLVYFKAEAVIKKKNVEPIIDNSVLDKIEIKFDSIYEEWLENELRKRFNIQCVTIQEFQKLPDVITKEGQIKFGYIRHEKDDRRDINNRRNFILGWSNIEKIKSYEELLKKLNSQLEDLGNNLKRVKTDQETCKEFDNIFSEILRINDFAKINWKSESTAVSLLRKEKKELEDSSDILRSLNQQLDEIIREINVLDPSIKEKIEKRGQLNDRIETANDNIKECVERMSLMTELEKEEFFPKIHEYITDVAVTLKSLSSEELNVNKKIAGENGKLKSLRKEQSDFRDKLIKKMREIKEHSKAETIEMSDNIEALPEYLTMYQTIESEDLPRHQKRFKEELNKKTIDGIALFDNKLRGYEKDIQEKIKDINTHLFQIDFNPGTYIEISPDKNPDQQIKEFREDLIKCYTHSYSDPTELYAEEKYEQVKKILDRFNSSLNSDIAWSDKVTDVRQWFEFNASEFHRADNTRKEYYQNSDGKSGGQKEKLAYTILASALAYQFGLTIGETKSRSFRFVVIDEAFGRGSDDSTKYGLELFEKLNLQLLIVTPLQKIHVIENYVDSFHFVSNPDGNNSQVQRATYHEYIEKKSKYLSEALA